MIKEVQTLKLFIIQNFKRRSRMKKKLFRLALVLAILIVASMLYFNKKMEEQKDPYKRECCVR